MSGLKEGVPLCAARPIDFVAEGIAGVASAQRSGIGCYHVVNPHWDDHISLDSIVDWVISAGYPIRCVAKLIRRLGFT